MKYMGSKNRISKSIIPIMLKYRSKNQYWVEPFVGGGNAIDKVSGNRIGSDSNPNTIEALVTIRDHLSELPKSNKEFTEEMYKNLRNYKFKGYAGFAFSYGGKWKGGWRRDSKNKRDYVAEAYRNAVKQHPRLQGVQLLCCNYDELLIPDNSIIYCDPPYQNTTAYKGKFNHEAFWNWCRKQAANNHILFISEYSAPVDFTCIWEKEINSSLTKDTGSKKAVERLFTIGGN